jgi:hypothetical protein
MIISSQIRAQTDAGTEEEYLKKNTAFTEFSRLGVNNKHYAKCVKHVNYVDADKRVKMTLIDKTEFRDDGQNNDQVANDGILTSTVAFFYQEGEKILMPGSYEKGENDYVVCDELFAHEELVKSTSKNPGTFIKCKLKWVRCSQMSYPRNVICELGGWPYGELQVECGIGIEIPFF